MKDNGIFNPDSSFMAILNKIGYALLVNILMLVCCIPLVTAGASLAAAYYSMTKSVRYGCGYAWKEFFRAFRRNLGKGCLLTLMAAALVFLFYVNREYCAAGTDSKAVFMVAAYDLFFIILIMVLLWLFPVLSRFDMGFWKLIRLSFLLAFKKLHITLALAVLVLLVGTGVYKLSVGFTLLLPAAALYASTFLIEPVFRQLAGEVRTAGDLRFFDEPDGK